MTSTKFRVTDDYAQLYPRSAFTVHFVKCTGCGKETVNVNIKASELKRCPACGKPTEVITRRGETV